MLAQKLIQKSKKRPKFLHLMLFEIVELIQKQYHKWRSSKNLEREREEEQIIESKEHKTQ